MEQRQGLMNGLLLTQLELCKEKYPQIYEQMLKIYANTTKWERHLDEDETRFLIEWSFAEIKKQEDAL